jgi:hypothetical protein
MPIDASIYGRNPLINIADSIQGWQGVDLNRQRLAAGKMAAQENALAMQQKQQDMMEAQQIKNALAGLSPGATEEDIAAAALRTRLPGGIKMADSILKAVGERAHKKAQTDREVTQGKKDEEEIVVKRAGLYKDMLARVNDKSTGAMWIQAQYQDPVLSKIVGAIPMEQALSRIPDDPHEFQKWRDAQGMGLATFVQNQTTQAHHKATEAGQQATREETARAHRQAETDRAANRNITVRGQNMVDARQRELTAVARSETSDRRATAAEQRVSDQRDKAVTKYADTLQKEGIPDFDAALSSLEGRLSKYKPGKAPGVGRVTGLLPDFVQGQEAEDLTNDIAAVKNTLLKARSGSAVSESELRRLVQELGTGGFRSEATVRGAVKKIRDRFEKVKANSAAGVTDEVKQEYEARGGTPIQRGGASFNSEADVEAAVKAGRVKKGDTVIVNGRKAVWE